MIGRQKATCEAGPLSGRLFPLAQASVMLAAALVSYATRDARFAGVAGALSLGALALLYAGRFTPSGRFGPANAVTAVRLTIVLSLSSAASLGPFAATLVVVFIGLDALDGYIARRSSITSEFGARFDMETDALLVLVMGLKLVELARLGAWMILPGLLRYAYVAASVLARFGEAPRSRFGRVIAGAMMTSLAVSAWPVEPVFRPLAVLASVLVGALVRAVDGRIAGHVTVRKR